VFASALGLRAGIDLAGLAIAGGLFIVPAFAAVQAWAGADYRARTVAAVNVLNAAFMTAATIVVAILQHFGVTVPVLFIGVGAATLLVAAAIWKTMPQMP
jgi:acyl-[acyl-carrier-protein]-phospholipid O-acyltransferase/long-chain-fatty-acid--[acyl-carrier-protein] ligase